MTDYTGYIRRTRLIGELDYLLTTGDLEYCGTAIEVLDGQGVHLFHLVIDEETRETHVLFLSHSENFRLSISQVKRMIEVAESKVRPLEEDFE